MKTLHALFDDAGTAERLVRYLDERTAESAIITLRTGRLRGRPSIAESDLFRGTVFGAFIGLSVGVGVGAVLIWLGHIGLLGLAVVACLSACYSALAGAVIGRGIGNDRLQRVVEGMPDDGAVVTITIPESERDATERELRRAGARMVA